jgi:hypothetical protein
MRNLEFRHSIQFVRSAEERDSARAMMKRIMGIDPTPQQWKMVEADPGASPQLAAVWRGEKLAATIASYTRTLPNGDRFTHNGQLCAEPREAMRKQGAGVEALLWTGEHFRKTQNQWLVTGLIGKDLYEAYYRKLMGIGGVDLQVAECRRLGARDLANEVARRIPHSPTGLAGLRLGIDDTISQGCVLCFTSEGVIVENGTNPGFALRGVVWPLLRWCAMGRGQRDLLQALCGGAISLTGWWRRPIVTLRLVRLFIRLGAAGPQRSAPN